MKKNPKEVILSVNKIFLLIFIFLTGSFIVVEELLSGMILSSVYGNTIFVWTSIFTITLFGLAAGYFLGAHTSVKTNIEMKLSLYIFIAGLLLLSQAAFSDNIMIELSRFGAISGSFASSFIIVFPPMVFLSTSSPLVVNIIKQNKENAGKTAGLVYFISTMGGVFAAYLFGLIIIPKLGIVNSIFIISLITFLLSGVLMMIQKKYILLSGLTFIYIFFIAITNKSFVHSLPSKAKIIYHSEGILGQIKVMEFMFPESKTVNKILLVNSVAQSKVQKGFEEYSLNQYIHRIAGMSSNKEKGSRALVIGYGAGSIASEFVRMGFETDAVEIDERIFEVAEKFFYYNKEKVKYIVDDARHFIRKTDSRYDAIAMDINIAETQYSYNYTIENFNRIRKILNPGGIFMINFQGFVEGERSLSVRSIYKTLLSSGFFVKYWYKEIQEMGDVIFFASEDEKNIEFPDTLRMNSCCKIFNLQVNNQMILTPFYSEIMDTTDSYVLTDNKPILEVLNIPQSMETREKSMSDVIKKQFEFGIPVFK